ncbi:helix-turn-helix domain-containing protein [Haloarcula marina]|uniref:helix-turn-helix domain-containing protein n=1 Tax=Haloarcula marina TaxID=2961574 RepID=UPI0020B7B3E5|nr:helix-turn-helix domain-containing protein [Halomicroarcula marina]
MATIAEFTVPPRTLALGTLFQRFPEAALEIERVVPTGAAVLPYFWVEGVDGATACEFLESKSIFEDITLVDAIDGRTLFRCRFDTEDQGLLGPVVDSGVTLLSATGTEDGWTIHVRGDEQKAVAAFDTACRENGIAPTLVEMHDMGSAEKNRPVELTDHQREALVLAYERGYFDEPRTATLDEIAGELDISRQALASRLRRGYRTLVESSVLRTE